MTDSDYFNEWSDSVLRAEKRNRERALPVQEADGHLRGCARLGKCRCATFAASCSVSYQSPESAEEALRRERDLPLDPEVA